MDILRQIKNAMKPGLQLREDKLLARSCTVNLSGIDSGKAAEKRDSGSLTPATLQRMNQSPDPRLPKQYDLSQDEASSDSLGKTDDMQKVAPNSKEGHQMMDDVWGPTFSWTKRERTNPRCSWPLQDCEDFPKGCRSPGSP